MHALVKTTLQDVPDTNKSAMHVVTMSDTICTYAAVSTGMQALSLNKQQPAKGTEDAIVVDKKSLCT